MRITPRDVALRWIGWTGGASLIAWACLAPSWRDADGLIRTEACLLLSAGIALLVLGSAATTRWRATAGWFAIAIVGNAIQLQVIDAGPTQHYQHYRSVAWLVSNAPWLLMALVAQTVAVVVGLRQPSQGIARWLGDQFGMWRLALLVAGFALTGATLSRDVAFYVQEVFVATWIQAINLAAVLLAALAVPATEGTRRVDSRWTAFLRQRESGLDPVVVAAAIGVTLLSAALSQVSYERHPHIGDEVSYAYQARYIATGMLSMPLPPILEAFNLDLFDYTDSTWYASAPPGWPFVLALGYRLGLPWLVNPVLTGACVVLTWLLVSETHDRRVGRMAALLLAASPWHALVGMSFMTHSASLAFALIAAVMLTWARVSSASILWALGAGLATGMVGMIRPLEGMIVGCLLGLWVLGIGGKRLSIPGILAFGAGALAIGAIIGLYNQSLTGNALAFPIMVWANRFMGPHTNDLGFGANRGTGWALDPNPGHDLVDAAINANLNVTTINTELFGWGAGSLLFIFVLAASRSRRRGDNLMLAAVIAVLGAHSLYWFSGGPDFAARYWYLMIVPLVALAASGVRFLEDSVQQTPGAATGRPVRVALFALCAMALANFTTWRAVDKYRHYLGMRADIRGLARDRQFGRSLVLIRGEHYPDFASVATYNPIDLIGADDPVYAWDAGAELRSELLPLYRDRAIWIIEGPSLTGRGFEVIEGPLTADTVLRRDEAMAASGAWTPPYAERLPPSFAPAYTRPRQ